MAIFGRKGTTAPVQPEPTQPVASELDSQGRPRKDRPTPSRREAEAARRERLHPTLSKKDQRKLAARSSRVDRMKTMQARDNTPEKSLMRDYIDSRRNLGEFLLPSLIVILALTFLNSVLPQLTLISTLVMYLFIILVIVDGAMMWRGFKKVLAQRIPGATRQGLLMYGMNRLIQIRRFRVPAPRVKRGEPY
ncbi:MAG: DUF3043 domain-containing protein [Propionibacteriaceae bacterium]